MSETPTLDLQRQQQAKQYARRKRRLFFIDLIFSGAVAAAWLILGWATALKSMLVNYSQNEWLLVALFGGIFFLVFTLLELPLEYYSGFVLPQRYGQSTQTRAGWVRDQLLGLGLSAVLGLPVLELVYLALRSFGSWWWLYAAAGYVVLVVMLTNLGPVLIMPLFNRYVPLGPEHADLVARLTALARRVGTNVSGVYRFDLSKRTKAANAALTGLGSTRRIILGDTLLAEFSADEVEAVIAHELGHHVHRDIPVGILVSSVVTLIGLYLVSLILNWGVAAFRFTGPADVAALPLFALALGIFGVLTLPLNNAYSRWRELRADQFSIETTRKPQAFADAMTRLANQNLADADPEPWVVWLLYSHPPIRDRVALAQAFAPART